MKRQFLFICLIVLILTFFPNCKGESDDKGNGETDTTYIGKTFKFKNKLFSVPSPFHVSDLVKEISASFNSDLMNPSENKNKYETTEKKALNLGVYTADLGYTNVYEQVSFTSKYVKVVRSLSSELQIMSSYTSEIMDHIEANHQNKDSLHKIFNESYREADLYLSDNDRGDIAVLFITGAWVEGLYFMTQISKDNKNQLLINRIGEQKYSLDNILNLMSEYRTEGESKMNLLYDYLSDLRKSFESVQMNYTYDKHIVLPKEKKTIILSNTEIIIDDTTLNEISENTKLIRNFIIK